MEEILNNWLQEKPKDKFDKELHKYTYYDLMEFAEHYHTLQLQQTGVSGSGIIGSRTPSLIKENDCFGCVRRNTDYDCLQCDLPNGYHYR